MTDRETFIERMGLAAESDGLSRIAGRLFGEDVATALPTIEMIAREDLTVLAEAASAAVTA